MAPLAIGMVLGPMTENNLRLTMQLLDGDITRIVRELDDTYSRSRGSYRYVTGW